MNAQEKEFLFELLSTPSPTGWEAPGQRVWARRMREIADDVSSDSYGNTWATLRGSADDGFKVMLEAHADEIGLIVNHIDDNGFLTLAPIGGSDRTIAAARRIRIFGDKGEVPGVIGNTAVHLRDQSKDRILEWKDHFADVGATSAKEVAELGIRVGHPALMIAEPTELASGRIVSRALDNRISGFILTRALAELQAGGERPWATTVAVNAVQEEVGCHGVRMVTHRIFPNVAICFDVTHATDAPGMNNRQHGTVKLGGGPTLSHGVSNHPRVVQRLIEVAAREGIPVQHEAVSRSTHTDTDQIFIVREGIPSALISIPLRYMHSPTEVVDPADVEHAVKLVVGFVRSIREGENFHTEI
jgi:Cellulase M and related proteins